MTDERIEIEGTPSETPTAENEATVDQKMEGVAEAAGPAAEAEPQAETPGAAPEPVQPRQEEKSSHVDYSDTFRTLSPGDVVQGVVVHIDKEGVLVDVGTKSEGIIRPGELANRPVQSMEDVVSVGEKIDVYVIQPENEEGYLVLSKKRADFEKAWERVQQAFEEGKTITAMVCDRVKGGLVVDLGIRGFIPGSHVGSGNVKNLDKYVGQSLPLKVIEVDRERRKVVLSHRLAAEEERGKLREETIASLREGEIREGVVRRITDFGAFVDLGGIDGLLHVSEMSWTRINHPSDAVKVGQKLQVMVLRLNLEQGRVSLGLRQILPDPWADVVQRWRIGDIVTGTISRLVPFGAFVQLDHGIEAIIPNAELSHRRIKRPEDVVSVGQEVEAKVIDIRPEERSMKLSMKALQAYEEPREHKEYDRYQTPKTDSTRMTLGDLLSDKFQELTGGTKAEAEQPEEAVPVEEPETAVVSEAVEESAPAASDEPAEPIVAEAEVAEEPVVAEAEVAEEPVVAEAEAAEEPASEASEPVEGEAAPAEEPADEPVAEAEPATEAEPQEG